MVEFALCFPILLLFSVSAIGIAHAEETANDLATVVRDGARYASVNPALYGGCANGATNCATTNTIQGVIQAEANSVNQSAGGVTLANTNCLWSGSATPPALATTPPSPATPTNASTSCMTIAYYTSELLGSGTPLACAYYSTSASAFTNVNGGNCTATSSVSAPIYVEVIVAVAQSATGNPMAVLLNGLHITPLMTRTYAMEVAP
jgi:Flp pilus assembly protein TadG